MQSCGDVSWEDLLEEFEDQSDSELVSYELVRCVLDVIDVPVPLRLWSLRCVMFPLLLWKFVEPQSCSFSKKRAHRCTDTQEEMRYEGLPVIARPLSGRKMTPPTPVQNSYTSFVRDHGRCEEGRGRTRMECERKNNHREDKTVFKKEAAV